ncbi:hypothetical protein [Mycobacteroides salmoniphilum]|uniref:Holin n=1 Tax=Mycobacteroides salmoniphilum TaxID=404941 RepID=A0A4R8SC90_9MYCO|nr:hypothetical protein [Mycobacteroides salmoniphilum]TDZ92174.1 hypothetical protein CCUG60885_04288 [Mycobacteroides salmoniphilum]TEA07403.1 hypothetical protein CCUG60883_01436 [Mycobacteroides salmoniphilum]
MTDQIRKWYYLIGALVASVVPILVTSGVVSDTQGNAWINAVVAIGGVLGVAGLGTAGVVLSKQIKNAPGAAADKAVTSLKEVQDQLNSTAQSAQDQLAAATKVAVDSINKIQATVGGVVGQQVSLGPLAAQVIKSVTE